MMTIETKKLKQAINLCSKIARRKATMPILACVNLSIDENRIGIVATDLTNYFECTVFGSWNGSPMPVKNACVNASALQKMIGAMKSKTLDLEFRDQTLPNGGIVRTLFINGAQLATIPADEFPLYTRAQSDDPSIAIEINNAWIDSLEPVRASYSRDLSRYNLNGVCFQQSAKSFYAVATDGHRLSTVPLKHAGIAPKVAKGKKNSWIMGADAVEFLTALGKIQHLSANLTLRPVYATLDGQCNTMKIRAHLGMIDGEFPNWEQVIPHRSTLQIKSIDKESFLNAARPCATFHKEDASDPACAVLFNFEQSKCTLTIKSPNMGKIEQSFNSYDAPEIKDSFKIGANINYMIDAVENCPAENVRITFDADLGPILIDAASKDAPDLIEHGGSIVMPIRLDRIRK